ncbi:phosphodiester glycosidase family protein [Sphingomonas sp. ACRSK]|uniref:phosphodiester glycosidase family protein n=1 Tax=Sphingomonas sp. ACRSK TaxID=2918213 RepID=UPI001EF5B002|nr:phosphodiester glycosidase family protein [Sphingomonas sp. ACRSK]MCG7349953.1 phosphodiester glycosidase family protein [Sphingomonas sp. ACRSK]
MIRPALLALVLAFPLAACATLPRAADTAIFPGIHYEQGEAPGPAHIHVVSIDLTRPGIAFALTEGDHSKGMEHVAKLTSAYLAERHAQVAINASYFLPFKGGSKGGDDYYPHVGDPVNVSGPEIARGKTVSPVEVDLDDRVDSMLCFHRARAVIVDGQQCPAGYVDGVAAGPRLLEGGKAKTSALDYATDTHPRTAFGISADRRRAWIVLADGRQADSKGMTLADLAELFRKLGASDAINLDGGGSSTLAVEGADGKPRLLNSAIHTGVPGRERPVANHILLFAPHRHLGGGPQ